MELNWLQTFVTAAERRNFRETAEQLHMAQPTVTLHIQKLERALGVELFDRRGRGVQLSAAGERFFRPAQAILQAVEAGRADLSRWRQGYSDRIRIAVSPLVATTVLPRWIQTYRMTHPDTEFSVLVRESDQVLDSLVRGESDLGFSRRLVHHPHVKCSTLYEDPIVLFGPADGVDPDGPVTTVDEWFDSYPVLTHNHPEYWDGLLVSLRRHYPGVRLMQVSQVYVTLHWITEKMGISFLPASTVQRELLRGTVREVAFPDFELPVAHTYLVQPNRAPDSVREFAGFVEAYMRERTFL